jgi:hypothetical protein
MISILALSGAVPDLGEAAVVGQQPLEVAVVLGPQEAGLDGRVAHFVAVLSTIQARLM